ncbi:MAG: hypothetical protein ACJ749_11055 [Flavisolibacter sp.]|jgi:hypothetical protein
MIVINKNHPDILANATGKNYVFVSIRNGNDFYFSSAAARQFGLKAGKFLHFLNEGKQWFFYQNDDSNGFMLNKDSKESSNALRVVNKPLVEMFRKTVVNGGYVKFFLIKASMKHKDQELVEIITAKTYDEMMKQ